MFLWMFSFVPICLNGCFHGVVLLLETAACLESSLGGVFQRGLARALPGYAIALPRWVPQPCRGGVLEGASEPCRGGCAGGGVLEGCRCWKPPHALGGLLCGRRGAPEGVP